MEDPFYLKSSGKLKKTSHFSFTSASSRKRDQNSVYSLEDERDDYSQTPTGKLSTTQIKYLSIFMNAICMDKKIELDVESRSIHLIQAWTIPETKTTVVCTLLQPHITNTIIGLQGVTYTQALEYSKKYFSQDQLRSPSINRTVKYCQIMGRYAISFVDILLENKLVSAQQVSWSNMIISQTQPIFSICNGNMLYECRLTHASCKVMQDNIPEGSTASPPVTTAHNYTFRSSQIRNGTGSGPSITVHSSGIIQYQGKPQYIELVVSSFKECIISVMNSNASTRFVKSLSVARKVPIP